MVLRSVAYVIAISIVLVLLAQAQAVMQVKHGTEITIPTPQGQQVRLSIEGNIELIPSHNFQYRLRIGDKEYNVAVDPVRARERIREMAMEKLQQRLRIRNMDLNNIQLQIGICREFSPNDGYVDIPCYKYQIRTRARLLGIIPVEVEREVVLPATDPDAEPQVRQPWWAVFIIGEEVAVN